jgi:hypothetical protein
MYDRVHVDEKWFFLTWLMVRYYLVPDAEQPHQVIGHKCHIPKCMHLAANERPRWDAQHNQWFSGKLRLWPVAHQVAAKRNSRHIPAGTLEWKSLGLTKEVYGGFLFDKVVPSILQSRPRGNRCIQIQQDNATPPLSPAEFQTKWLELKTNCRILMGAVSIGILNFTVSLQTAPDMNVNDLCFFASLQALKYHNPTNSLHQMITRLQLI